MYSNKQVQSPKKTSNVSPKQRSTHLHPLTRPTHPASIIQQARASPDSLTSADVLQLQRTIGNEAVGQLMSEIGKVTSYPAQQEPVQRQGPEEEELLQGKMMDTVQRQGLEEEEELMQGKMMDAVQRQGLLEEEELMQGKFASGLTGTLQAKEEAASNSTGMPDEVLASMESTFNTDFSGVRIHANSPRAPEVGALAYTRGQDIHFAPGQFSPDSSRGQQLLGHELTHVVQQREGRVRATTEVAGILVNDSPAFEKEADSMGAKATVSQGSKSIGSEPIDFSPSHQGHPVLPFQAKLTIGQPEDRQFAEVGPTRLSSTPIQRKTVDVNNITYKLLQQVPGTNYRIVRRNWRPSGSRYLFNTNTNHLFANTPLTGSEATTLITVFQGLNTQNVGDLDKLVKDIDHARELAIEVRVTLARLQLVHKNIRDVVLVRIKKDHNKVRTMLNNTVDADFDTAFDSLEIPGSDPHKGGQVVVFVNYKTLAGGTAKIVYKPGNLTIDRLLYGDNPNSVANQLGASMANYRITKMTDLETTDKRLLHYGYMEYVEAQSPQNAGEVRAVYRSLGENLAIAYVFGLRDIHHENFILLQDRLLFIDMEAATGTFTGFGAMELASLPNALAKKIANALVGQTHGTVTGWLPTSDVLKQDVQNGFTGKIATLNTGPDVGATVTAFSNLTARFVPFPTADLQLLGGRFLGKLGADPKQQDVDAFNTMTQDLATSTADGAGPLQVAFQTLLRHQTTKDALNRGDVPFWTRRGNNVYAESGTLIVAAMPHPRLDTAENIATGANTRRSNPAQALTDFQNQVAPMLGTPHDKIQNDHIAARTIAGHNPP